MKNIIKCVYFIHSLEKSFVLLPRLKLYACTHTWVCAKLYGRASFIFCRAGEYRENFQVHPWNLKVANEN